MTIVKDFSRQKLNVAIFDILMSDLTSAEQSGVVIDMPVGSVISFGDLVTTQAWNSTSTDVIDVGDATSATRYVTDANIRALAARVALVPTGFVSTGEGLRVTWTSGGGTPSTGKTRLMVGYYTIGKEDTTVG